MFCSNWTKTGQGGGGKPPPPGQYRLYGLTVIAFIVMYGLVALPLIWVARPYDERWPILLLPATPFVSILGAWKLVVWFGFWRFAFVAFATAIVGTLSHPIWMPLLFGIAPASTCADWIGTFVILCGLTGWLMAAVALVIGPIRLLLGWLRRRNAKSCVVPPKRGGS